jgi:formylglycine-generating enzyme required for sulfatase activity
MVSTPGSDFTECSNGCPTMIVVPAGKFTMGSPDYENGRMKREGPQHDATIGKLFAVGRTAVTFAEWDNCVAAMAYPQVSDNGWGRGDRPATRSTRSQSSTLPPACAAESCLRCGSRVST